MSSIESSTVMPDLGIQNACRLKLSKSLRVADINLTDLQVRSQACQCLPVRISEKCQKNVRYLFTRTPGKCQLNMQEALFVDDHIWHV